MITESLPWLAEASAVITEREKWTKEALRADVDTGSSNSGAPQLVAVAAQLGDKRQAAFIEPLWDPCPMQVGSH